jgi:hypothetical protein
MSEIRLGQILVEGGVLTTRQVDEVLTVQERTGEPFGVLAERLFGVAPEAIEEAWASQYARLTRPVNPEIEAFEPGASELVTRRQAWQFRILPMRFEGRELLVATTQRHLRRALRFATNVIGLPVFFVIAEPLPLGRALCARYPLPGMRPESILDEPAAGAPERILGQV